MKLPRFNSPTRLLCIFLLRRRNQGNALCGPNKMKCDGKLMAAVISDFDPMPISLNENIHTFSQELWGGILRNLTECAQHRSFHLGIHTHFCFAHRHSVRYITIYASDEESSAHYSQGIVENLSYYKEKVILAMVTKGSSSLPLFFFPYMQIARR